MVYSYDINENSLKVAAKNLEILRVSDYVVLKNSDITQGIEETEVDAVILDMPVPWLIVPHAKKALRGGGVFVSFSPTIEQVIRTVTKLREHKFHDIEVVETLLRRWRIGKGASRPETFTVGHTGFIVFARKVS